MSDIKIAAEELTEACFKGKDRVRALRDLMKTMKGEGKDTVLALMQYLMVVANVAGFDRDDLMMKCAVAMERAFSLKDAGYGSDWKPEPDEKLKWN